jgi:hypothetical protein
LLRELLPVLVAGLVPIAVLALIVIGTTLSLVAWQPPILQTTQFGTADSQNGITALSLDPTGVYAAGFVGYVGAVPSYMFVNRYTLDGHQVWTQQFGNPALSIISAIGVGVDGVYIAGNQGTQGIYPVNASFVKKYDLIGNEIWNREFGGGGASAPTTIAVGTSGVFVGGYTNESRPFVKDYDFNGGLVWTRLLSYSNGYVNAFISPVGLYVSSDYANGSLVQKYGVNGTLSWTRTCTCGLARISGDSTGIYGVGTTQTSGGIFDGFLSKYDLNGNQLWTTSFSAPGFDSVRQVEVSADSSGVYLATTTNDLRGIVMKYDGKGNHVWSVLLPWRTGTGSLTSGDVIAVGDAGVYVGGDSRTSTPNSVGFIAQITKSSSLVFFGVNPPYSFGLVGLLAALVAISVLSLRRRLKKKLRAPRANVTYRSQKIPGDICRETTMYPS